jgi:hypothetical protein
MGAVKTLALAAALSLSTLCAGGQQQTTQVLTPSEQLQKYLLKSGIPSSAGIDYYVNNYDDTILTDFQERFGVELFIDLYFYTDSLGSHDDVLYDSNNDSNNKKGKKGNRNEILVVQMPWIGTETGYYANGEVIISSREVYFGYNRKMTSDKLLENIVSTNKFVRGTMIHEMAHGYIQQVIAELKMDSIPVQPGYRCMYEWCKTPGAKFIEEGVAEYCAITMGEVILGKPYVPKTSDELLNEKNNYNVNYRYSPSYLKKFLDNMGLHQGLKILLSNDPPTPEEMLDSEKYFSRLRIHNSELKLFKSMYK